MITIRAVRKNEAEILIHEAIGQNWFGDGMTSKKFREQLKDLGDVDVITVRINSPGGAVNDGIAIYNALRNHGARINVVVEGYAASIASIIAMAGDHISMAAGSLMMIHSPWTIAMGNAKDMRKTADVLQKHEEALLDIYVKRSGGERDELRQLLQAETWFTGEEAVEQGLADEFDPEEDDDDEQAALREAWTKFRAEFEQSTAKLSPMQIAAAIRKSARPTQQEVPMPRKKAASATNDEDVKVRAAEEGEEETEEEEEEEEPAGKRKAKKKTAKKRAADEDEEETEEEEEPEQARGKRMPINDKALETARREGAAAEAKRRSDIRARFPQRFQAQHADLLNKCMDDPDCTPDQAANLLLDALGKDNAPLAHPNPTPHVSPGADEAEKFLDGATSAILARIGSDVYDKDGKHDKLPKVDASNPFRGFSLYDLAAESVARMGINMRGMNRSVIVAIAFGKRPEHVLGAAGHSRSDFPTLLENVMHKLLLIAYQGTEVTWPAICRIGDLNDFRAHNRYRVGTFSDIQEVNELGNYVQGTIPDAEKEVIQAKRKGRLLVVSRELIVNDDLQGISDMARGMGRAANRTVDKDVYALFALNGGTGPTMGDGTVLFHTVNHKNIANSAGAPTVTIVDLMRVEMASQMDPAGNDYVGIRPAIALAPLSIGSTLRVLNESQYDPDAANKLQRPNVVRGIFSQVVDTPRLTGNAWYMLASPSEEPVFEVGFLGGAREPRMDQQIDFNSDSLTWKVVHEYGVAAVGWRGINKNTGAGG